MIFFVFFSCSKNFKNSSYQITGTIENEDLITIDLDNADLFSPQRWTYFSSVFNKVKTIILETNKDALVTQFFKFSAYGDFLYILNSQNPKEFLIFNKEGKFIRKIGGLGGGPGEYIHVYDFTIDPDNQIIYLLCDRVINKYSIDGVFLGALRIDTHTSSIQYSHGKLYVESRTDYLLRELDIENGKQTNQFLDRKQYNKGWVVDSYFYEGGPFKHRSSVSPKFVHLFMDTIVTITKNGPMPFLAIKSKHLTTNSDLDATAGMKPSEKIEYIKSKNRIFCITHYFETKNHIYFRYYHGRNIHTIFYDLISHTYQHAALFNDFVFKHSSEVIQHIIFSDSNGVYESFYPLHNKFFFEKIRQGELAPDLDKRDQLMKLDEEANPVIFYYSYD